MTLLRSQEARVLPGKRQKWGENARKVKDIVAGHGVEVRYFQATLGAVPGTIVSGSVADDWAALASRSTAINEDPKFQGLMQEVNNDPDGPMAEPLSLTLYEDINEQLGGAAPQVENATVYQAARFRILPGRRANALELLRQVREAIGGAGRQIPSGWEVAVGEAGILLAITAYESLAALAEARSQGQAPGVQEILQKAQADSKFPYFEQVDSRILTDITDQL
jgi:hypothetical protein